MNVTATQRLLEQARLSDQLLAFVAASSSSVYGSAMTFPTTEQTVPAPVSPYGVTKLAAEHLCTLYGTQFGVPTISLRYFTVYGPRQRPDMAISKLINCALTASTFRMNGDGSQRRDFTYVADAVNANIHCASLASTAYSKGLVFNVGGGSTVSMNDVLEIIEDITGKSIEVEQSPFSAGDPLITQASSNALANATHWSVRTAVKDGIARQIEDVLGKARNTDGP